MSNMGDLYVLESDALDEWPVVRLYKMPKDECVSFLQTGNPRGLVGRRFDLVASTGERHPFTAVSEDTEYVAAGFHMLTLAPTEVTA